MSQATETETPSLHGDSDLREAMIVLAGYSSTRSGSAFVVGGAVRDAILGRPAGDIDVATDGDPQMFGEGLASALGWNSTPLDDKRGILRIAPHGGVGLHFDVAPLRGGIDEDLGHRDFSIDAMAFPLSGSSAPGEIDDLVDPHGGRRDLESGVVRALSPQVFSDDPVRLMRAQRLASQLKFAIEEHTADAMKERAGLVTTVAPERVREELIKILEADDATASLRSLDNLRLLCELIPELEEARGVEQPKEHHWDVLEHCLEAAGQVQRVLGRSTEQESPLGMVPRFDTMDAYFDETVSDGHGRKAMAVLAGLLHDVAKPATKTTEESGRVRFLGHHTEGAKITEGVMRRLRFSSRGAALVSTMVEHHLRPGQMAELGKMPTARAIYRYYRDVSDAATATVYLNLADYLAARGPDLDMDDWSDHCKVAEHILRGRTTGPKTTHTPLLGGHEIMEEFLLSPGSQVGVLLEVVREAEASGEISTKQEAILLVKSKLYNGGGGA
jgi:poly(A) polymerase